MAKAICSVENCSRETRAKGLCGSHYMHWHRERLRRGDIPVRPISRGQIGRFWLQVHFRDEGCWEWTGEQNNKGYGRVRINSVRFYAHRFAYELLVGPIPEGLELDHLCRNPVCVRPDHLEPVTHQENVARALFKTHCQQGHALVEGNLVPSESHRKCLTCKRDQQRGRRRTA